MSSILYMKGRGIQLSDFVVVVGGVSNPDLSSSAGKVDVGIFSVFSASSVPSAILSEPGFTGLPDFQDYYIKVF